MAESALLRRLAIFLRRNPWVVVGARSIWRLTRPRFSVGVVGVVLNEDNQILMVEHVFHPYTPWGLPGGWVERNEHPAVGVQREIQEELSLAINVDSIIALDMDGKGHLDLAYLCTPVGVVGKLSFELLQYRWFDADSLPQTHAFNRIAIANAMERHLAADRV